MKILSCGAGMQSTALALMACEQAITGASLWNLFTVSAMKPASPFTFWIPLCTRTFYRILGSAAPSASRGGH